MKYKLETLVLGPVQANCYIVTDLLTGDIAVIDPGAFDSRLSHALDGRYENVKLILLTHRHFDHILGAAELKERTGAKIAVHADDAAALSDAVVSGASVYGFRQTLTNADLLLRDGDLIPFGADAFSVIHTPGHTAGGVCYRLEDMLITGDTLFEGDMGRTDLPSGDYYTLITSLERLMALDFSGTVYPGHGSVTTLERERKHTRI